MSRWFTPRVFFPSAKIVFEKLQSAQSPLAVILGWEEVRTNPYWKCGDRLYEKRGNDFIYAPTRKLSELMEELNAQNNSTDDRGRKT